MIPADERPGPIAVFEGASGARVEIFDESRPYGYFNLFQVILRVLARFPGDCEPYERVLRRTGVYEEELEAVRRDMLARYRANTLPYLLRADFSERLAAKRARERCKVLAFRGAS